MAVAAPLPPALDLTHFLVSIGAERRSELYSSEFVATAVLRSLPPLAKQYALRLLYVEAPVGVETVRAWHARGCESQHGAAMDALLRLGVLTRVRAAASAGGGTDAAAASRTPAFLMTPALRKALRAAVENPGDAGDGLRVPAGLAGTNSLPSAADLREYATECWQELLMQLALHGQGGVHALGIQNGGGYVAGGGEDGVAFDPETLFKRAGLVRSEDMDVEAETMDDALESYAGVPTGAAAVSAAGTLTRAGYAFLLADEFTQLSVLLREYVTSISEQGEKGGEQMAALLAFLFRLAFLRVGEAYALKPLPEAQQRSIMELAGAGIVFLEPTTNTRTPRWFAPTHLAASLAQGLSPETHGGEGADGGGGEGTDGDVIVETNFRVYVYTSSDLRVAIMSLFVKPLYRLPNLMVGLLTRDSVTAACTRGVSAEQIVSHLRSRSHWRARQRAVAVPETVADQVRLWEAQRYRLRMSRAVLYAGFPSVEMSAEVAADARRRGCLLWERAAERKVVVRADGADETRSLIKRLKREAAAAADIG